MKRSVGVSRSLSDACCAPTFLTNRPFLKPADWFSYHPPRGHLTLHDGVCAHLTIVGLPLCAWNLTSHSILHVGGYGVCTSNPSFFFALFVCLLSHLSKCAALLWERESQGMLVPSPYLGGPVYLFVCLLCFVCLFVCCPLWERESPGMPSPCLGGREQFGMFE